MNPTSATVPCGCGSIFVVVVMFCVIVHAFVIIVLDGDCAGAILSWCAHGFVVRDIIDGLLIWCAQPGVLWIVGALSFLTAYLRLYAIVLGTGFRILLEFLGRNTIIVQVGWPASVSNIDAESTRVLIPWRWLIVVSSVRFGSTVAGVGSPRVTS